MARHGKCAIIRGMDNAKHKMALAVSESEFRETLDALNLNPGHGDWDSIRHFNLIMELEARWGASVPMEDVEKLKTFHDFYFRLPCRPAKIIGRRTISSMGTRLSSWPWVCPTKMVAYTTKSSPNSVKSTVLLNIWNKCLRHFCAIEDHILFEVHAKHIHFALLDIVKIRINGKTQITFSTAKIKDFDCPLCR